MCSGPGAQHHILEFFQPFRQVGIYFVSTLNMREVRHREAVAIGLDTQEVAATIQTQDSLAPKLMFPITTVCWPLPSSCPCLSIRSLSFNKRVSSTYHVPGLCYFATLEENQVCCGAGYKKKLVVAITRKCS